MCRVVIKTWVEPEWECGDGCCWVPPERRWAVVETDIPWRSDKQRMGFDDSAPTLYTLSCQWCKTFQGKAANSFRKS